MRLTWLSNAPWTFTGYANQTALFAPRLQKAGHEMAVISFWGHEGMPINWNGIQVFGKSYHPYGLDIMHSHSKTWKADAMLSLMDAWVIDPAYLQDTKWIPWFPIDSEPLPTRIYENVKKAYARLVFSKFGCEQMDNAGLDYHYIPHGVDTANFKPLDMAESREALKFPKDKYIVGMVAANKGNPPRKAFHQNIQAFGELQKKHKDCVLYLHTTDGARGGDMAVELIPFIEQMGLTYGYAFTKSADKADVIFADQYGLALGYSDAMMAQVYSAMDVHMLVSMGEGFGIPILEAQACGTPVIVGDWTSMSELCFSGWKVDKKDAEPIYNNLHTFQYLPHAGAIADKLEQAYQMRGNQEYRTRARDGAMKYDADKVTEKYWLPVLAKIEAQIQADNATLEKAKSLIKQHTHEWGSVGQFDGGFLHVPCLTCDDAMKVESEHSFSIVKDYFKLSDDLKFKTDKDGVTKLIIKEIKNDYQLDGLIIGEGDFILDIGAHKGIVSCYLAKKYPQAKILSFEPVEDNYNDLLTHIRDNGITNVTPFNCAVTKDGRKVKINVPEAENSGSGNIYSDKGKVIKSLTLDEIFKANGIDKLSLLKIDCEGSEFEILGSANGLLKRVSAIRGEFHRSFGDVDALLAKVKQDIPNVVITLQG